MTPSAYRFSGLLIRFGTSVLPAAITASLLSGLALAAAQPPAFDATELRQSRNLDTGWLVIGRDDPGFARPTYDDAQWMPVDGKTGLRTSFPNSYPGVVWYRLHLKVAPGLTGLALQEKDLAGAFEVYANGAKLMQVGQVTPYVQYTSDARLIVPIPDEQIATGSLVLALRVHLSPSQWSGAAPGPDPGSLLLGQADMLNQGWWLSILGDNVLDWTWAVVVLVVSLLSLTLFNAQRQRTEYLWTFLLGIVEVTQLFNQGILSFVNEAAVWQLPAILMGVATDVLIVYVYFGFVRQKIKAWVWVFLGASSLLQAITLASTLLGSFPIGLGVVPTLSDFAAGSLGMFVIPAVLLLCLRRGNREAAILLLPLFFSNLLDYTNWGGLLLEQIPAFNTRIAAFLSTLSSFHLGPIALPPGDLGGIPCWLSLAAIMVLRANRASRQQALLEGQVAAAREVQQVILPEQVESIPGYTVESVYQPAQQVGGDFFQILPAGAGGLLVVVGDVAGKGLPAAMLVSVLVGAIRGVAEYTVEPGELLASLNERLVGRGGGSFSTALVAHIAASGELTIANAGHLSPYLDGQEMDLPGALPLGVVSGAKYETTEFFLPAGSRLTFYSDGVVEAQNQRGELFGFERAQAISTKSAAVIAEAAMQFGQEDDITVVTIERLAAADESGAMGTAPVLASA